MEGKSGKQGFYYDTKKLCEPITKSVKKQVENYLKNLQLKLQEKRSLLKLFLELVMLSVTHRNILVDQ